MQIIGQKHNLEIIDNWKELPQFLIVQGDRNTGKTHFIVHLCEKFNLKYVRIKNSVDDVRNLIDKMTRGSNTVYHFKDFDKASLQAKNALLKITEEPIEGNYIVISGRTQIKTLESRAKKIVMQNYTMEEIVECMKPYYEDEMLRRDLYISGINTPSKVQLYCKYEQLVSMSIIVKELFENITLVSNTECVKIMAMFDIKYDKVDACYLFLDMLIHRIEYKMTHSCIYDYFDILNILITAKESIERDYTLNRKFVIYRAFNSIHYWCTQNIKSVKESVI